MTRSFRLTKVVSATWLLLWIGIAAWTSHTLATVWPYVQFMPQVLLFFAVPGILFQAGHLLWMWRQAQPLPGKKRFTARVIAIVAGLVVAAQLMDWLDGASLRRFEAAMAPFVAQAHAQAAAPCPPAAKYPAGPDLHAYLADTGRPQATAELHHDRVRFVLALSGGSMDIDGSTLFYDSRTRAWRKVHNDILAASGELEVLRKDLEACRIVLR